MHSCTTLSPIRIVYQINIKNTIVKLFDLLQIKMYYITIEKKTKTKRENYKRVKIYKKESIIPTYKYLMNI